MIRSTLELPVATDTCSPEPQLVSTPPPLPPASGQPRWRLALLLVIPVLFALAGLRVLMRPRPDTPAVSEAPVAAKILGVSALGRLNPAGDVRSMAAPAGVMGAMPRVSELAVDVGDRVRQGQLLARFDNADEVEADVAVARAEIASLEKRVRLAKAELARYQRLISSGAIPQDDLDLRERQALALAQQLELAKAKLKRELTQLPDVELRAPFDSTVIAVHAREGERPDSTGVLDLARNQQMQAVLEVYESDINRVRLGQRVLLQSENGGFSGELSGRVVRIDPQVKQRGVLSTDPTADTDARVVEVRVALEPQDAARVSQLTGLKLIGRFRP
ncbi:MAG: HlyD family efflux transporter periplasmic adaptor subunit [Synechococcus sp.]|nr:HlyD family efflux transporter periplasmic adaptor subunit [Synechococcus sp.]